MGHTRKDSREAKADRTPRVQAKIRKNNNLQNLTRNVDMFLDEDEDDTPIVNIWDSDDSITEQE